MRDQIPIGLNDELAKIESEIRSLQVVHSAAEKSHFHPTTFNFDPVESNLRAKISEEFATFRTELSEQIETIWKTDRPIENLSEVEWQLPNLEQAFRLQEKRRLQRISVAEATLGRFALKTPPDNSAGKIEDLSTKLRARRLVLTRLRGDVKRVRNLIESSVREAKATIQKPKSEGGTAVTAPQVPDLSHDLRALRSDFEEMADEFRQQISQIHLQTEENEKQERDVTDLLYNLNSSLKEVAEKICRFGRILNSLSEQADQAATKLNESGSSTDTALQNLLTLIRSGNAKLVTQIQSLREKVDSIRPGGRGIG
jgi:methyl-accepting chemotaxis protein